MNGLYELSMKTPMGVIKGNFYMESTGDNVSGYIEVNGKKNFFDNGKIVGKNRFLLSGTLKAMLKKITYNVEGEVLNDDVVLHTKTNMGSFDLQGRRLS